MPRIEAASSRPPSRGSSPRYSKLRPFRGSRARLAPPASSTLKPFWRASLPIMAPPSNARAGLKVEARARPEGRGVASSRSPRPALATPRLASLSVWAGMPYLGWPGIQPADWMTPAGAGFISTGMWPCSKAICSSSDMRSSRSSARRSGDNLGSRQGCADEAARAAAPVPTTTATTTPAIRMRIIEPPEAGHDNG